MASLIGAGMGSVGTYSAPYGTGQKRIPPSYAEDDDWVRYLQRFANPFSTYRCRHMARATRNLFYYLDRQWIELDRSVMLDGVRGYVFRDLRQLGSAGLPRPVTNYIAPAVENEVARLGRKEFVPGIPNSGRDPKTQSASVLAKEILQYKLNTLRWPEIRDLFNLTLTVTGTAFLRSAWDMVLTDTVTFPSADAVACPSCGAVFSQPHLSERDYGAATEAGSVPFPERLAAASNESGELQFNLTTCPECPDAPALQPRILSEQEAAGDDFFGRPLSQLHPRGDVALETPLPWEMFIENSGIGIDPHTCRVWARSIPRPIIWLEERWPEHCDKYQPDSPEMLMRLHPMLGEWIYVGRYDSGLDSEIYGDHMLVTELVAEPYAERLPDGSFQKNKGRVITMVGGIPWGHGFVVENTDLMIPFEITDKKGRVTDRGEVAKVCFTAARFKTRLGEFHGHAQVDSAISPQNRVNVRDAMFVDTMEHMGTPNIMKSEGMELRGPEWIEGYGGGKVMTVTKDPLDPQGWPQVWQGQGLPADAWQERSQMKADLQDILGAMDVEMGEVPRGLKTTSGLLLTGENAAQRRLTRERAIVSAFERTWSHILKMLYALRTEEETYEVDAKGASMTLVQRFRGADLLGQYNVRINKEAAVDHSLIQSEAAAEALQDQVYDLTDPVARARYLELRRLPEINDRMNYQIERAKEAAVEFRDEMTVPTFDPTMHDPAIWHKVLSEMWLSTELREKQQEAGWDEIIPKLGAWEQDLNRLEMQDAAARAHYSVTADIPPPQQIQAAQIRFQQETQAQMATIQRLQAATVELAKTPDAPPPPPPPVMLPIPPPVFLPFCLAYRIEIVWSQRLGWPIGKRPASPEEQVQEVMGEMPPAKLLDLLLQYRAVTEEARITATRMAAGITPGMPPPPPAPAGAGLMGGEAGALPPPPGPPPEPPLTGMDTQMGEMAMPGAVANAVAGGTLPWAVSNGQD